RNRSKRCADGWALLGSSRGSWSRLHPAPARSFGGAAEEAQRSLLLGSGDAAVKRTSTAKKGRAESQCVPRELFAEQGVDQALALRRHIGWLVSVGNDRRVLVIDGGQARDLFLG